VRSEKLVAEARGQFGNPGEAERPPLKAATKQQLVKTEKTPICALVTVIFGVCNSVKLSWLFVVTSCKKAKNVKLSPCLTN
jgi:hypothetical protein